MAEEKEKDQVAQEEDKEEAPQESNEDNSGSGVADNDKLFNELKKYVDIRINEILAAIGTTAEEDKVEETAEAEEW